MSRTNSSSSVDGFSTAPEWQLLESDVAVLAIGATEQHGRHLPLLADTLQADHMAQWVAEEFGAARLPTMPYGTSLEHAGFRGTVSLSPELLMAFVERLAEEVEQQGFRILLLLSGHGGNYAIAPKVRAWNRDNRDLHILLVEYWRLWPTPEELDGLEVHCGVGETSVMMAIHPDLVKTDERRDYSAALAEPPAEQGDLNTFGIGRLTPAGVWGYPSKASAKLGRQLIAGCQAKLRPWIQQRLEQLREDSRYSGALRFARRSLLSRDLPACLELMASPAPDALRSYLEAAAAEGQVAIRNGRLAGCVVWRGSNTRSRAILFAAVPQYGADGLAEELLAAAPAGQPLQLTVGPELEAACQAAGFKKAYARLRYRRLPQPLHVSSRPGFRKVRPTDLPDILDCDACRQSVAHDPAWLTALFENGAQGMIAATDDGLRGYVLLCGDGNSKHLGPLVADSAETAEELLVRTVSHHSTAVLDIEIPDLQPGWAAAVAALGFACHDIRHTYVSQVETPSLPAAVYACSGR